MRIFDIDETLRGPNLDAIATRYVVANKEKWKTGEHIGDIDEFSVKQLGNVYSLWDGDIIVATTSLSNGSPSVVDQIWVSKEHRGQKLLSKLLWFYKTRLNHSQLLLGDLHSSDMQEVVKGLSRFHKYWYKDGKTEPFNLNTLDKFYGDFSRTGWLLLLENDGNFSGWPVFSTGKDYIRESYEWQVE